MKICNLKKIANLKFKEINCYFFEKQYSANKIFYILEEILNEEYSLTSYYNEDITCIKCRIPCFSQIFKYIRIYEKLLTCEIIFICKENEIIAFLTTGRKDFTPKFSVNSEIIFEDNDNGMRYIVDINDGKITKTHYGIPLFFLNEIKKYFKKSIDNF